MYSIHILNMLTLTAPPILGAPALRTRAPTTASTPFSVLFPLLASPSPSTGIRHLRRRRGICRSSCLGVVYSLWNMTRQGQHMASRHQASKPSGFHGTVQGWAMLPFPALLINSSRYLALRVQNHNAKRRSPATILAHLRTWWSWALFPPLQIPKRSGSASRSKPHPLVNGERHLRSKNLETDNASAFKAHIRYLEPPGNLYKHNAGTACSGVVRLS